MSGRIKLFQKTSLANFVFEKNSRINGIENIILYFAHFTDIMARLHYVRLDNCIMNKNNILVNSNKPSLFAILQNKTYVCRPLKV